jgi:putative protease
VTQVWRAAIDAVRRAPEAFKPAQAWTAALDKVSEGRMHTLGAYNRPWK